MKFILSSRAAGFLLSVSISCCFGQLLLPATIFSETCPSAQEREETRNNISQQVLSLLQDRIDQDFPRFQCPCGGTGEWIRTAYLNMSDPAQQCPPNWTLITSPVRGCGRSTTSTGGCDSALFSSNGRSYSRVCGRVYAYQQATTDAFGPSTLGGGLEGTYVEGVSLTRGAPGSRQHIWSFASAWGESTPGGHERYICPCTDTSVSWPFQVSSFVGNNYFCDTGHVGPDVNPGVFSEDPLWDGEGCDLPTHTCCDLNNPPWFCTTLPTSSTDDLELRMCFDSDAGNENLHISLVEIYTM